MDILKVIIHQGGVPHSMSTSEKSDHVKTDNMAFYCIDNADLGSFLFVDNVKSDVSEVHYLILI